jgi:nucleoside-diphosphate-sugar epimerase
MKKTTNKTVSKAKKNVVVTGGAGFIGHHLVNELVNRGYEVFVVDNLVTGKKEDVHKDAHIHVVDIGNLDLLKKTFEIIGSIDYVFHLACRPRVQFSIDFPDQTNDTNITGTLNVLIAARDLKVKRVVFSSSSSIYGDQTIMPLVETMKPNPKSPYGLQKYVGELYLNMFSMIYGLETVCLRYFNVYGPEQDPSGGYAQAIPKFVDQVKKGGPMTITGDGEQTRDFTHVRDVVNANILAVDHPKVGKGEVINIGGGKNVSMNYIAKLIGGKISYIPARLEPKDTLADNKLAKKLLGWEAKVSLEEGIKELRKLAGLK